MYRLAVFSLLIIGLILITGCGLSDDTIAKVGGTKITVDEFKYQLGKRYPGKAVFTNVDSVTKATMINRMVTTAMKVNAAKALGLDKESSFINEFNNQKSRLLGQKYFERTIVDKLVSEQELRESFEKRKEEVRASHILLSFQGGRSGDSERTKEEALRFATELKARIDKGENFDKLAEEFSNDPSAKRNKGDLGYFSWGRMVDEFQKKAFSLKPGEVSDPTETPYGYHIIKVVDRRINPEFNPDNFEAQKLEIKRSLYFAHQDSAMKMWRAVEDKLKKDNAMQIMNENVDKVVTLAKEKQAKQQVKAEDYTDDEKNIELAKWKGGRLLFKDFMDAYQNHFDALRRRIVDKNSFQKDVENRAFSELITKDAERMGLLNEKDIKLELKEFSDQNLVSAVEKREITDKAQPTDEDIKKYYEEHKDEYKNPAEIELWEVYLKNESTAKKIAEWAKSGKNFEALAAKYSEDEAGKKKKGYQGFKAEKRYGVVSQEAFKAGANKIVGPIKKGIGWSVIKTGAIKAETQKTFEDASSQVKSKVRTTKLGDRRKEWEEAIKAKNTVTLNTKVIKNV